jgi:hypothetical protein
MRNKYEIRGDVTAIYLNSKKYGIKETLIDTVDLPKLQAIDVTWYATMDAKDKFYVKGDMRINGVTTPLRLHRCIMDTPDDLVVDHINHDTLDNRRSYNLRNVTRAQNNQNQLDQRMNNKTSGYRGVCWDQRRERWVVNLRVNGKKIYSGVFEDLDEAVKVSREVRAVHCPMAVEYGKIDVDPSKYHKDKLRPKRTNKSGYKYIYQMGDVWVFGVRKLNITRRFNTLPEALEAREKFLRGEINPTRRKVHQASS